MAFLIPDEILEQLICSICKQYLSAKPVKVYPNGITKCGRCSGDKNDGGVISIFGNIAENGLFRCVNRFEGCTRYLRYAEVAAHESKCLSGIYLCPLCSPEVYPAGSSCQFLIHYKTCHKNEVLHKAEFCLDITEKCNKHLMYYRNDGIYVIYANSDIDEKYLIINASNIGSKERCSKIKQKFKFYTLDKKLLYESGEQPCSSLDNNSLAFKIPKSQLVYDRSDVVICNFLFDSTNIENFILIPEIFKSNAAVEIKESRGLHNVYPKIYLNEEFKKIYPEYYLSSCETQLLRKIDDIEEEFPRICDFCENIFQNCGVSYEIYKCDFNHYVCRSCFDVNRHYCKNGDYRYSATETDIYRCLFFFCKWNCKRFYCGQDLIYHENHCKNNDYLCYNAEDLTTIYFGPQFVTTNKPIVQNSNVFLFRDIVSQTSSKRCVITRDNFNFILNWTRDKSYFHFWFTHDYAPENYYFLVRIKEKSLPLYCRVNSFSLPEKGNIIFFAVILKKVNI